LLLSDPIGRQRSIQGSDNWKGQNYAAFQNYRGEWHDQGWWHNHYNRIVLISAWRLFVLLEIANRDRYVSLNSPALRKEAELFRLDVLKKLGE
jgi:hypothetical protein